MTDSHQHDHGFAHPVSVKLLLAVFSSLVFLTILTVVLNDLPLGSADIIIAMTIATIKATLVMLFFMHIYTNVLHYFSGIFTLMFYTYFLACLH